jgi:hypothetical protein
MPYMIARTWYPPNKSDEIAKKYLEVMEKYPPDESIAKTVVPAAVKSSQEGLESIMIDEVERAKVGDAYKRAISMMIEFRNIEGFRYEVKIWSTVVEALDVMGLGS